MNTSSGVEASVLKTHHLKTIRAKKQLSKASGIGWKWFRFFLLFGLCFVLLYPLIYMLAISFRNIKDIYDPSVIWVSKNWTFKNITDAIEGLGYFSALKNSFLINIGSSLIQTAVCAVVGYGFARFDFKFKKILFGALLLTIIVPPQLISTPMYIDFKYFDFFGIGSLIGLITGTPLNVNLLNSPLTFYLPALFGQGIKAGLFIFIYRQFFSTMPRELDDAANIDGCGFIQTFTRIMLPNVRSGILVVVVLSIVWYWNDYFLGSLLVGNMPTVTLKLVGLPTALHALGGFESAAIDPYKIVVQMQAGCLLVIAPILAFYLVIQKFFIQGVERSGIVG